MTIASIKRSGLLVAFVALGASAFALSDQDSQIKISRALNSPTLAVRYSGVHVALVELKLNGESYGTRTMDETPKSGETTFTLDLLALKDGDNEIEIRLFDKAGRLVGSEKTTVTTDSNTKGPVFLSTPKVGDTVTGPVEITVGFGRDFKNTYVSFFVDSQFKSMTNFPPYTYNWDTTREQNGWHELEAWVVDDTSATFKTRKVRVFVNNPGGRTYRKNPEPAVTKAEPKAAPAATKTSKPAVAKAKPAKGIAPLPAPQSLDLVSPNKIAAGISGAAITLRPLAETTTKVATAKTMAIAPAVTGLLSTNSVMSKLEGSAAGLKPTALPESVATGLRLMTPTGKRMATPKVEPAKAAPVKTVKLESPKVEKPAVPAPKKQETAVVSPAIDMVAPNTSYAALEKAALVLRPLGGALTGDAEISNPVAKTLQPDKPAPLKSAAATVTKPIEKTIAPVEKAAPAVKPVMKQAATEVKLALKVEKPAAKPVEKPVAKRTISVDYGTKLPISSTYTILYGSQPLTFDVAPRVEEGVPVTPFRHLIEKAGGEVKWAPDSQEITAITDGKDIWLKIGDKVAKINAAPVSLELAPFLEKGRTIVPLSFIKKALNVEIEYDKATGHVLITPKE